MSRTNLVLISSLALAATTSLAAAREPPAAVRASNSRAADRREIVEGEQAWGGAFATGDARTADRLVAEDFREITSSGAAYDKAGMLNDLRRGPNLTSSRTVVQSVRFFGDTAVAMGVDETVGPAPELRPRRELWTDTWVKRNGRWRVVAAEDVIPAVGGAGAAPPGEFADEKSAIIALRANSNRAIAAHDLEGAVRIDADDFVIVDGDDAIDRSAAQDRASWAKVFAQPGFDRYVRTPSSVEIGENSGVLRAAETGTWEGALKHGEARPYGAYFAHWTKRSGQWRVVSETYVTLGCDGAGC